MYNIPKYFGISHARVHSVFSHWQFSLYTLREKFCCSFDDCTFTRISGCPCWFRVQTWAQLTFSSWLSQCHIDLEHLHSLLLCVSACTFLLFLSDFPSLLFSSLRLTSLLQVHPSCIFARLIFMRMQWWTLKYIYVVVCLGCNFFLIRDRKLCSEFESWRKLAVS